MTNEPYVSTQELLDLLPLVADQKWTVRGLSKAIRNSLGECPICAIVNEINNSKQFRLDAGPALGSLGVVIGYATFLLAADGVRNNIVDIDSTREQILQILQIDA